MERNGWPRWTETGGHDAPKSAAESEWVWSEALMAIEEGNPSKDGRGWYNYEKLELLAAALKRVRRLQTLASTPLKSVDPKLVQYVTHVVSKGDAELWEQSKAMEKAESQDAANSSVNKRRPSASIW